MDSFRKQSEKLREKMIAWRRDFHRHPELAFEEIRTGKIVAEVLAELGLEVQRGIGKTGVVGVLEGKNDGPTILVRADMDALPILEANATDYVSQTPNKMHACGHDGHTAIALSVATMLAAQRDRMAGRVKFVFQPAEEIGQGAMAMINDGVMENPKPDFSVGLHLWNDVPVGQVAVTDGPAMAGSDSFSLTIYGRGGHAAQPQQTHDPIVTAAQIINAAQTIVNRNISPLDAGVVSFTAIQGGDTFNVIPEKVEMKGTFRAYRNEVRDIIVERFEKVVKGIAESFNCQAEFTIFPLTPPLVNDVNMNERLRRRFTQVANDIQILTDVRTMGAEDMACFLERAPGTYFFVGSANAERGLNFPHHHPRFDVDEEALVIGATLLASAVGEYVFPE